MPEENIVIEFDKVNLSYDNTVVFRELCLKIEKGAFLTVIGSSGGGKTTMLKLVNGLLKPQSGTVYVNGKDIAGADRIALRRSIGYVVQEIGLFPHMTIERNITYVPDLKKRKHDAGLTAEVDRMMELMGLDRSLKKRHPGELSGGQRQRVGIARALIDGPEILLMDEPFGAVDEITREKLQEEIADIHRKLGVTVLFITHDIREAMKLGTKVLVLNDGMVEQYGTPEELRMAPATEFVKKLVR